MVLYPELSTFGRFLRNGRGFPATLKIPISPGLKFRKLVDFPDPLSPRTITGIPIGHSSLSRKINGHCCPISCCGSRIDSPVNLQRQRCSSLSTLRKGQHHLQTASPSGKCISTLASPVMYHLTPSVISTTCCAVLRPIHPDVFPSDPSNTTQSVLL